METDFNTSYWYTLFLTKTFAELRGIPEIKQKYKKYVCRELKHKVQLIGKILFFFFFSFYEFAKKEFLEYVLISVFKMIM